MAATDSKASANIVPCDAIQCVDGEWYYCPGEYPEPCHGPFSGRAELAVWLSCLGSNSLPAVDASPLEPAIQATVGASSGLPGGVDS